MSGYYEERYTLYEEKEHTARQAHKCSACDELIPPGARYCSVFTLFDGSVDTLKRCSRCQAIHDHLKDLCASSTEDIWPAERLDCDEDYEETWGDMPLEAQELAFLLPGEQPGRLIGETK